MKKLIALAMATITTIAMCTSAFAITKGNIVGGYTYVPIRGAFGELGFAVDWDQETNQATLTDDSHTIVVPMDKEKEYITVDGKNVTLAPKQLNIRGSIYLPLRAVSEAIGAQVAWDDENKLATLEYNNYKSIVSCDSKSYLGTMTNYAEFPNVPDIGVVPGVTLESKTINDNGGIYVYDVKTEGTDINGNEVQTKLMAYGDLFRMYGFEEDTENAAFRSDKLGMTVTTFFDENTLKLVIRVALDK